MADYSRQPGGKLWSPNRQKRGEVAEQMSKMRKCNSVKTNALTDPDGKVRAVAVVLPDAAAYVVLDVEMLDRFIDTLQTQRQNMPRLIHG